LVSQSRRDIGDFDIDIPRKRSHNRGQSSATEDDNQRPKKRAKTTRHQQAISMEISRPSYIAHPNDSYASSPGSEGPPSGGEDIDIGYQPRVVTLEDFLYKPTVDEFCHPSYMLSGIDKDGERMAITLEPYLRPLDEAIITADIDSVIYISRGIPTTNDINWVVHNVTEDNISKDNHLTITLDEETFGIHQIPNMYVGRLSQNNIFTIYVAFPGLKRQINGKWTASIDLDDRRDFYNTVFYPALRRAMPRTEWGHVPLFDYDAETRRKTDFQGRLRQAQLFLSNSWLNIFVEEMRSISEGPTADGRFSSMLFMITAKNAKLLTRSTVVDTKAALENQLAGLDFTQIDKQNLFVDVGFEILPNPLHDEGNYTLAWRKSRLKVK
jgi:hypothetical protein